MGIFNQALIIGTMATAVSFIYTTGNLDISVGNSMALAATIGALIYNRTGNIALMGISLARGDLAVAGRYLIPVAAYAAGIFLTEWIRMRVGENGTVHWKEGILWLELLVMVLAGFMPQKWNSLVNCLIGFSCAMQVEAFRKMHGMAFATTMCTGNLRSGTSFWPWELLKTTVSRGSTDYGITGSTWSLWPVQPPAPCSARCWQNGRSGSARRRFYRPSFLSGITQDAEV